MDAPSVQYALQTKHDLLHIPNQWQGTGCYPNEETWHGTYLYTRRRARGHSHGPLKCAGHAPGPKTGWTVISKSDTYQFVPSNPWLAVGWRKPEDIEVPLAPVL